MDVFKMKVHPSAEIFPMMSVDELKELADDIFKNGLQNPIVVQNNILVDGRNRLAACKIAGVDCDIIMELAEDKDVDAFIVSSNINRRHMTKGAKAMAVARIYPEGNQGKKSTSLKINDVNGGYLRQARTVLKYASDISNNVLSGSVALNEAYKTALQRKQAAESGDEAMETLRRKAPDLADLVTEERMELSEALAALQSREQADRANAMATINIYKEFIKSGAAITRDSKHTIPSLKNMRSDIEDRLECTINEAISKIKQIDKDILINILEHIE